MKGGRCRRDVWVLTVYWRQAVEDMLVCTGCEQCVKADRGGDGGMYGI